MNEAKKNQQAFLESIARKAWLNLNYANSVEETIMESSIKSLMYEEIDKSELKKLEDVAKSAKVAIDDMISDASVLGFEKTIKYLNKLKKELPGSFSLVKLMLSNDPEASAKQIGKVASTTNKINSLRDSFYDAVVLFGSELAKLPYSQNPEATAQKAVEDAKEAQQLDLFDDKPPEDMVGTAVAAFKDSPLEDIASNKFMTWAKGIKFPDKKMLRQAAINSYKEPPKPEGFLGKVSKFFGFGDLAGKDFADDMMKTSLSTLIDASKQIQSKRADAEAAEKESNKLAQSVSADLQDLAQGDSSALASPTKSTDSAQNVKSPVGNIPADKIQQVTPGTKVDAPQDVKGREMIPMPDLERKVTAPEDIKGLTPELAALINDDPKSNVLFFDPEEAEKVAEESEEDPKQDKTKKEWVHHSSLSNILFEEKSVNKLAKSSLVHKSSLKSHLFTEAIMFKDVEKALIAQGVSEENVSGVARDLAARLENQFDITVSGMPKEKAEKELAAASKDDSISQLFDYLKSKDEQTERMFSKQMDDLGLSRQQGMELTKAVSDNNLAAIQKLSGDTNKSVQSLIDATAELGSEFEETIEIEDAVSSEEQTSSSSAESESSGTSEKGKRVRSKNPPTNKLKDRGKEVGLKPKEGETGDQFGGRVRREEEKQGKRSRQTKQKTSQGTSSKKDNASKKSKITRKGRGRAAASAAGFGTFSEEKNPYYLAGNLSEALLGPKPSELNKKDKKENNDRWLKLAGLEEK